MINLISALISLVSSLFFKGLLLNFQLPLPFLLEGIFNINSILLWSLLYAGKITATGLKHKK